MPENMAYGIRHIMGVYILEFILIHGRTVELGQQLIVIGPVRFAGVEQHPVAVKNNNFQHCKCF